MRQRAARDAWGSPGAREGNAGGGPEAHEGDGAGRLRRLGGHLAKALLAALAGVLVGWAVPVHADVGEWTTNGPGEGVSAVAVSPVDDQRVLAAGETGVWRTADGGGTWTKISGTPVRRALAVVPLAPDTVYGVSADARAILKSADGGVTWTPVYSGTGSTQVFALVADPAAAGTVFAGVTAADGLAQVLRTTDGGATWTAVLPAALRGAGGLGQTSVPTLAALPGVPGLVVAGVQVYHGGFAARSTDGGTTWTALSHGGLAPLAGPSALAVAGSSAPGARLYFGLNVMQFGSLLRSDDAGATWTDLTDSLPFHGPTGGLVANLVTNPIQPRWAYLSEWDTAAPPRAGVFATPDRGQTWPQLGTLAPRVNGPLGLALAGPSRTLYAATDGGVYQLTIAWPALPAFQPYYDAHDGFRLLGTGISLETEVDGRSTQYFEKGRLEDHSGESADPNWQVMYGLLTDELHQAGAPLPVGGDVSPLTYAGLHALTAPALRVAPPPGYAGSGTQTVAPDGTTFVPFTADLSGAPGHLVPGSFWAYLNREDLFPAGWLHDVGLPIAPAQQVQVTKYLPDGPVERTITVQAFQRAILTDDPLNPPDWRVERANAGSDYRKFYPDRVGP